MTSNPFAPPVSPVADVAPPSYDAEVAFELKYRDLVMFNWAHMLLSPFMQAMFLVLPCLVYGPRLIHGGFADALPGAVGLYLTLWALQLAVTAAYLLSRRNRTLLTTHQVNVRTDGYHQRSRYGHTTRFWPGVQRVASRPGFIAIYVSQSGAQLIPDRAFATAAQRDEFLRFAREQVRRARRD